MMFLWFVIISLYTADTAYGNCNIEHCENCNGDVCLKCKDIYYLHANHSNCLQCSYTCYSCGDNEDCVSCASDDCDLCSSTCPNDMCQMKPCADCKDGFFSFNDNCFRCKSMCTCNDISTCTKCLPGWYGDNCDTVHNCSDKCRACNKSVCIECLPGWYGYDCELSCPAECIDNVCDRQKGECVKGIKCSDHCSVCMDVNICSICMDGFYKTANKCANCYSRCLKCSNLTSCSECKKAFYWGPRCEWDCTGCYSSCNKTIGCSTECEDPYYQTYNTHKSGYECERCPNTEKGNIQCTSCTNGSYCNACESGFWGSVCQYTCEGCDGTKCDKETGCFSGCFDGYLLSFSDNAYICIPCPDHCENCSSSTTCLHCKEGFYSSNNLCLNCSENCESMSACNRQSGACSAGCKDGWWGEKCDKKCPPTCKACEQFDSYKCSSCYQGHYGDKCEYNCSINCVVTGEELICEKETGYCTNGCKNFSWGYACKNNCSAGCNGFGCNPTNGICVNGCADDFYGKTCNSPCSKMCQFSVSSSSARTCDAETGACLHFCEVAWYGTFCNKTCIGHCNGSVCNKNDGKCTFGCAEGYTDENCIQEQVSETDGPKEEGNSVMIIGASAGAGAALVLFVAVVILVIILRLRHHAVHEDTSKLSVSLEATNSETANEPTYSRIQKKRAIDSSGSVKTAGGIALNDTAPNNNTDARTNQACPDTYKYAKRDTRFRKHSLKEDACQVSRVEEMLEETEFAGKSDPNTYYNTTGRRIPLDKLAEYVELKAVEDIENDFYKLPQGLSTEKEYTVARQQNNILKNRYKFIYPYDESRVVLKDGGNDFINASYIEGFNRAREYIGAMGPFEKGDVDIVPDFWRMIWQEQCETIVMLTKLVENRQTKCKQYWPDQGTSETYGDLHVTCTTEDVYADFIVRSFTVTKDGETLRVRHLHFTAWPDKTVPDDVTCLIEFRQKVRSLHKEKTCPIIVHCSAGIGRTGTFIALDILTFEGEARGFIDIFGCVATIRYQRVNLVQTPEQYVYLHHSVVHSLTFNCQPIQADMFIEHYRKLNEKTDGSTAIAKQYEKLQSSFPEQSLEESSLIQNKTLANKIRKGADLPGDGYRVILHENRKPGASDFINAAFVNGFRTRRKFIAAQTPLPATVVDFLSMVIQEKCSCIVMMDEQSLQDKSAGVYWPADNQVIKHGVFQVSCVASESFPNYTVKKLVLTCHGQGKESTQDVHLFMFTAWPKESVTPKTPESLLELIKAVDVHARGSANKGPIIVHCMTGSQRSCLYCAVSVLIEKMEIEHEVSVVNTLRQIKSRRHSAIPTLEQYKFCHQAIECYLQSFDIYSNFGLRSSQAVAL